ncbi:MAG: hypothetical protein VXY81_14120 [Pseudomonadota bacterium]|nr:hypothetical protein [Pseudomonadota bacterium]
MAHFAKLDVDNNVIDVVVVNNDVLGSPESEAKGIAFLTELTGYSNWKQCSYNLTIRKNFPGIGVHYYDPSNDMFVPNKAHESHTLNTSTGQWDAPLTYPSDGKRYSWDEATYQADNTKGWVEIIGETE